jgi:hypothetical protein
LLTYSLASGGSETWLDNLTIELRH